MRNWIVLNWRELLARFALVFFCIALWHKGLLYGAIIVLVFAWLNDGGLSKFVRLIKEPLVLGILVFCGVWVLGLLWSDLAIAFQSKWKKHFFLLTFIPFLSLLNKARLPWAIGALISSYLSILAIGSYQWAIQGMQGVPWLNFSYLGYSAALGAGVILAAFTGCVTSSKGYRFLSWLLALFLLFLQFNQSSRGMLVATLMALLLMIVLRYRFEGKILVGGLVSIVAAIALFAISSNIFHERLIQAGADLQLIQQGNYQTSLGYRFAVWEIGLHGIAERPILGHGTGMAKQYFEEIIATYKQGILKNQPEFQKTVNFHNELIEIGMQLGFLGILAFMFLLWCWFQSFKRHRMDLLGATMVCFIIMAGLTHAFLLFNRIPLLLLVVTALAICWRQHEDDSAAIDQKHSTGSKKTMNP